MAIVAGEALPERHPEPRSPHRNVILSLLLSS